MTRDNLLAGSGVELERTFGLVASDTRIDILRALWDVRVSDEDGASFSELRERVGVSDGGRFNYHLGKLVPEFVRKRDERYELTHAGAKLIGDAVSGTYTETAETSVRPAVVGDCHMSGCDGNTTVEYRDGELRFGCDTCDRIPDGIPVPPIVVESTDADDVPAVGSRFSMLTVERANRGFCHLCDGPITQTVARFHPDFEPVLDGSVDVIHECRACGEWRRSGARSALIGHPVTVSLLYDAGVDYREIPHWEQTWLSEATERLVGEDPVRVAVTAPIGGAEHRFILDGSLDVVDRE
ncbi:MULTISPECIES: winged helix-turn-helix domain-containing protein [unclassified Halorubrum]|uniref:winged helix-turn-helix domain-containing protein n=1 Tax=unclassified Halorubrum TaxID=2642239 RepID=UPI001313E256|nr:MULTISPECIES: winged helix-turn-helix domain-containing protein [unclassified Halorubrum]